MFGKNEIVGQKYFKDAGDKYFITSMFMTLQGEGPVRGEPAFFIRLAKCNLACSFCDTYFDDGEWMSIEDIDQNIFKTIFKYYNNDPPKWVLPYYNAGDYILSQKRKMTLVITGGEPSLQNLDLLLRYFDRSFLKTQIESNGILLANVPESTIYVVSPKCAEKNGKVGSYIRPNMKVLARADCLKFVMEASKGPYSTIPDWALEWHQSTGKQVFVSPMNIYNSEPQQAIEAKKFKNNLSLEERSEINEVISFWTPGLINMEAVQKNHEHTAKYCIQHGLTFNMQMHLFAGLA